MQGTVTELESIGTASGVGGQYIIRHRTVPDTKHRIPDVSVSDAMAWTGFHYQPGQWSFLKNGKVCC
jgi:hypothetical protein